MSVEIGPVEAGVGMLSPAIFILFMFLMIAESSST